ncbi:MAG: hypothetical protein Q8K60_03440 [Parachlamydiaceae bacterium]|nr:hypothetical protein [Parachlamydiaceae bacterium]
MQKLLNNIYAKLDEVISSTNFLVELNKLDSSYSMHGYIPNEFLGDFKSCVESFGFSINVEKKAAIEIDFYYCAGILRQYVYTLRKLSFGNKKLINYVSQYTEIMSVTLYQTHEGKSRICYYQILAELAWSKNYFEQLEKKRSVEHLQNELLRYADYFRDYLNIVPIARQLDIIVPKIYINRITSLCKEMQNSHRAGVCNKTRIYYLQEIRNTLNVIKNEPYRY